MITDETGVPVDLKAAAILATLRDAAAHPEQVGPRLQLDEVTTLLAHVDTLAAAAAARDALAAEFWRLYMPHGGKDRALAVTYRDWPEMYRLLVELPNPHERTPIDA